MFFLLILLPLFTVSLLPVQEIYQVANVELSENVTGNDTPEKESQEAEKLISASLQLPSPLSYLQIVLAQNETHTQKVCLTVPLPPPELS